MIESKKTVGYSPFARHSVLRPSVPSDKSKHHTRAKQDPTIGICLHCDLPKEKCKGFKKCRNIKKEQENARSEKQIGSETLDVVSEKA